MNEGCSVVDIKGVDDPQKFRYLRNTFLVLCQVLLELLAAKRVINERLCTPNVYKRTTSLL